MPGRLVRSKTAERVAELLGSRQGRAYLSSHGWEEGMPIVMTGSMEPITDVMSLVSVHAQPALVAMLEPATGKLQFLHISVPNPALQQVEALDENLRAHRFFERLARCTRCEFRVKYWKHSAVAHWIPNAGQPAGPAVRGSAGRY